MPPKDLYSNRLKNEDINSFLTYELDSIHYPAPPWVTPSSNQYDVVIIGAGMAGLTAAAALKKLGIVNLQIFDQADKGREGPWVTSARMLTLRSSKELVGPALDISALTFRTWFERQFGKERWEELRKIPTTQWMDYLEWLREALQLPIQNNHLLTGIIPQEKGLILNINDKVVTTSKLVLATGRAGYGGSFLPAFIHTLPSDYYAHTNSYIDFKELKNKKVGIIGAGASGFDAAATALEHGAALVDILLRRPHLPSINKAASLNYAGFSEGYYHLSDEQRCISMLECYKNGIPPPVEALERVKDFSQFAVKRGIEIRTAKAVNHQVHLETRNGLLTYDFLILATGFEIDGRKQPELTSFFDTILLWKDRDVLKNIQHPGWFDQSPYLGGNFQFLEKTPGTAPFLKNVYCFNYAATLSHGLLSGDIPGISTGACRLARGIASDLFTENWQPYHHRLEAYQTPELMEDIFHFFH